MSPLSKQVLKAPAHLSLGQCVFKCVPQGLRCPAAKAHRHPRGWDGEGSLE